MLKKFKESLDYLAWLTLPNTLTEHLSDEYDESFRTLDNPNFVSVCLYSEVGFNVNQYYTCFAPTVDSMKLEPYLGHDKMLDMFLYIYYEHELPK